MEQLLEVVAYASELGLHVVRPERPHERVVEEVLAQRHRVLAEHRAEVLLQLLEVGFHERGLAVVHPQVVRRRRREHHNHRDDVALVMADFRRQLQLSKQLLAGLHDLRLYLLAGVEEVAKVHLGGDLTPDVVAEAAEEGLPQRVLFDPFLLRLRF